MHERLFGEQLVLCLPVVGVVYAAVHRTYRGALWLIVEAHAFGALVCGDVVDVHAARVLGGIGIDGSGRGVVASAL